MLLPPATMTLSLATQSSRARSTRNRGKCRWKKLWQWPPSGRNSCEAVAMTLEAAEECLLVVTAHGVPSRHAAPTMTQYTWELALNTLRTLVSGNQGAHV